MVTPTLQPRGFFMKACALGRFDSAREMTARLFVTAFRAAQSRFVHCFMRGFGKGFEPHHVDAGSDPRFGRFARGVF